MWGSMGVTNLLSVKPWEGNRDLSSLCWQNPYLQPSCDVHSTTERALKLRRCNTGFGAICSFGSSLEVLHCVSLALIAVNAGANSSTRKWACIEYKGASSAAVAAIISVWWFTQAPVRRGRDTLQMHRLVSMSCWYWHRNTCVVHTDVGGILSQTRHLKK